MSYFNCWYTCRFGSKIGGLAIGSKNEPVVFQFEVKQDKNEFNAYKQCLATVSCNLNL